MKNITCIAAVLLTLALITPGQAVAKDCQDDVVLVQGAVCTRPQGAPDWCEIWNLMSPGYEIVNSSHKSDSFTVELQSFGGNTCSLTKRGRHVSSEWKISGTRISNSRELKVSLGRSGSWVEPAPHPLIPEPIVIE